MPGFGNALEIALWAPLFWLPVGTPIRPMGAALFMFLIAGATLVAGGACATRLFAGRRHVLAAVCLLASLSPVFVAGVTIRLAMDWRGLTSAD